MTAQGDYGPGLARPRSIALRTVAVLVTVSTAVAFGESYRALFLWAGHHDVPAGWAFIWPAMVDVFVAVGELALFVGMADRWAVRHRAWAWTVTAGGLAVSVAGNVGHVGSAQWTDRLTAAVPPIAAFVALTVALGIMKRVVERATSTAPGAETDAAQHRAVLDYAETDAQRVRYAIRHVRAEIGPIRAFLSAYGYDVAEANVMSVLRRMADKPGPIGSVNGSNGHAPELQLTS